MRRMLAKKTLLLQNWHFQAQLKLEATFMNITEHFWLQVLWQYEKSIKLFGKNDRKNVWRTWDEALKKKNTLPTVYLGSKIMLWVCFVSSGTLC